MEFINFAFLGGIGFPELVVIFVIILLLFGAKKLPDIAKSLGEGIKEFKKSMKDETDSSKKDSSETTKKE